MTPAWRPHSLVWAGLLRGWRHPASGWTRAILIGVLGAWLGVLLAGGVRLSVGLATLGGAIAPSRTGITCIELPPFGSLSAHTHRSPVRLTIRVDELHVAQLVAWAQDGPTRQETMARLNSAVRRLAWAVARRALLAGAVGATLACLLLGMRRGYLAGGVVAGALSIVVPLAIAARTYQPSTFANPIYQGELSRASSLLQAAQQGWRNYSSMENRIPVIVDRVVKFYRQLDDVALQPTQAQSRLQRVLHISDLHNNPLGLKFALDLAREYQVSLVLVTGDVTDYGHPLEADLLKEWAMFPMPVVLITGNHDSRSIARHLAEFPNVTVLDNGEQATVAGITVMGFGDPAAARAMMGDVNPTPAELRDLQQRIEARLHTGDLPAVLMVHNDRVARRLLGRVPVILNGHSHSPLLHRRGESVVINPGTTGAAGLRYFTGRRQPPYGAAVLHFLPGDTPRLQWVDFIEMEQPTGNFAIRRQNVARAGGAETVLVGMLGEREAK